jgi:hypothetical protein
MELLLAFHISGLYSPESNANQSYYLTTWGSPPGLLLRLPHGPWCKIFPQPGIDWLMKCLAEWVSWIGILVCASVRTLLDTAKTPCQLCTSILISILVFLSMLSTVVITSTDINSCLWSFTYETLWNFQICYSMLHYRPYTLTSADIWCQA